MMPPAITCWYSSTSIVVPIIVSIFVDEDRNEDQDNDSRDEDQDEDRDEEIRILSYPRLPSGLGAQRPVGGKTPAIERINKYQIIESSRPEAALKDE